MNIPIDLTNLYEVDGSHVFITLDEDSAEKLGRYPEIISRLKNSLYFIQHGGSQEKDRLNSAFIRAALCELVSIEDVQKELKIETFRLYSSGSPLLCVVRELRNLEIHFNTGLWESSQKDVLWGNIENPENATETNIEISYISDLKIDRFENLNNYKTYTPSEFSKALEWFDMNQKEWGVFEMLYRAVNEYAKELSLKHG